MNNEEKATPTAAPIDNEVEISKEDFSKLSYRQKYAVSEYGYLLSIDDAETVGKMLGSITQEKDILAFCRANGKQVLNFLEQPEKIETFDKGLVTAIGIGLLIGFIGTPFLANLWLWRMSIMSSLSYGAIGGVFGFIGSVTGYTKTKSTGGALVGAIIGAMIIPGLCYLGFSSHILAF